MPLIREPGRPPIKLPLTILIDLYTFLASDEVDYFKFVSRQWFNIIDQNQKYLPLFHFLRLEIVPELEIDRLKREYKPVAYVVFKRPQRLETVSSFSRSFWSNYKIRNPRMKLETSLSGENIIKLKFSGDIEKDKYIMKSLKKCFFDLVSISCLNYPLETYNLLKTMALFAKQEIRAEKIILQQIGSDLQQRICSKIFKYIKVNKASLIIDNTQETFGIPKIFRSPPSEIFLKFKKIPDGGIHAFLNHLQENLYDPDRYRIRIEEKDYDLENLLNVPDVLNEIEEIIHFFETLPDPSKVFQHLYISQDVRVLGQFRSFLDAIRNTILTRNGVIIEQTESKSSYEIRLNDQWGLKIWFQFDTSWSRQLYRRNSYGSDVEDGNINEFNHTYAMCKL